MAFYRASGTPNILPMQGAASTVLSANGLVVVTSGVLAKVGSTGTYVSGICLEERTATDADYATARPVLVDQVDENALLFCDNVTGTLTKAMEGTFMKLSSTAGLVADAGTSTETIATALVLICVGFVSSTSGYFKVAGMKHRQVDVLA